MTVRWIAPTLGLATAGLSAYAWRLTGSPGHLAAAIGFAMLGFAWGRVRALAWAGVLLILGGSMARWMG